MHWFASSYYLVIVYALSDSDIISGSLLKRFVHPPISLIISETIFKIAVELDIYSSDLNATRLNLLSCP